MLIDVKQQTTSQNSLMFYIELFISEYLTTANRLKAKEIR
jgi:hypothetical protein